MNEDIIVIKNPIDSNVPMKWLNNTFTINNHPGPHFQKQQKKEALKYILEKGKGVIDCGAHIGDFGVCLAVILKALKRSDIIVYCIDPSEEKCNFMKQVCKLNNLDDTNIKIINCGLSDKIGKYSIGTKKECGRNTGGWEWIEDNDGIPFTTLDQLYKDNIIGEIGFFWLDAQWMEEYILTGGEHFLSKCKPYILMEYWPVFSKNENGTAKNTRPGTLKELESDPVFNKIFNKMNIIISKKSNQFDDFLLEFK